MERTDLGFASRMGGWFFTLWIGVVLFGAMAYAAPVQGREAPIEASRVELMAKDMADQWGIQILGIQRTAANYMLDFRYRVLDVEKAKPIFKRKTRPYLLDQASGAKFTVFSSPKTGPLRSTDTPQAGRNYFTIFANPGKYIQAGNQVTVVIGAFRAENLIVH